jgi:hypothetical protein
VVGAGDGADVGHTEGTPVGWILGADEGYVVGAIEVGMLVGADEGRFSTSYNSCSIAVDRVWASAPARPFPINAAIAPRCAIFKARGSGPPALSAACAAVLPARFAKPTRHDLSTRCFAIERPAVSPAARAGAAVLAPCSIIVSCKAALRPSSSAVACHCWTVACDGPFGATVAQQRSSRRIPQHRIRLEHRTTAYRVRSRSLNVLLRRMPSLRKYRGDHFFKFFVGQGTFARGDVL